MVRLRNKAPMVYTMNTYSFLSLLWVQVGEKQLFSQATGGPITSKITSHVEA